MSGNQKPQISLPVPTWRCRDLNAGIPIKKRKYFVLPEEPGGSAQPDRQGDTRSALDLNSSDAHVNQKMIAEGSRNIIENPIPSSPSVSVGNYADKKESIGNLFLDQIRVKVEEPNIPIHSSPLAVSVIPFSSNIVASSIHCSVEKPHHVGVEQHLGVVTTSDETVLSVEQTVLKTHDIVHNENLRGECQTEASTGAGNEEPSALNLSLSKGVCTPHVTDSISTCTKSGNLSGVNRSNWDLNTTMDAWEDGLDRKTRVKTNGSFFDSNNRSCPDIETSSCGGGTTVIAKPVSEKLKENVQIKSPTVTSTQCSLSLGLRSYPPIEKSTSLLLEARDACTSCPRPIMTAGNVNSVNVRTVKSEVIEESAQAFPMALSINRAREEVVGSFRKENSIASGCLNPVDSVLVKAEPNNFTQSEGFSEKDGTLNLPHRLMMQSNFMRNQRDTYIPYPSGISNAPICMKGMTRNPGFQSYSDSTLKENSGRSSGHGVIRRTNACSGHGDHNLLNASDVSVSVTEDKILDDCKTYVSGRTDELFVSGEDKVTLSGKEVREELYSYEFQPDCGNDLLRVLKKQVGRTLYVEEKVQRPPGMFAEGFRHAETEQRDIAVHNQMSNHVEEKESQAALVGKTGDNGEQSTHQIIHASEGMSGVSTLSCGKVDNPELVDNISPASYKAEISTVENDPPVEISEGSQSRIKTVEASDRFVPLRMERDRLFDFSLEQRRYLSRGSDDDSYKFSRERYHGQTMRSPRLNFMPDRKRFYDNTESNLQERDTKNFESSNYGNTRRGGAFMSNSYRGRQHANDEAAPFPHSFTKRTHGFSFTQRDKEDASAFHGFRDGEKFTRGVQQSNDTEPMFMSHRRPYRGRNSFTRGGRTNYPEYRSRSPIRSRERSAGPSSSFRNRSQQNFSEHRDFSHRRSPSGYRMGRVSSPEHSGYPREIVGRRHNSPPPYSHRPSNAGRGRGYSKGRGYAARGRGYGRDGISFRKPYDRVVHRNFNNFDHRERVEYSDDFFEGPIHSERCGVDDDNIERRQFGYRYDGASSFRQSFNSDGTNVEDGPDDARQDPDIEMVKEQGILKETDGKDKASTERTKNMEEEETSKYSEIWQGDELGGDGF